MLRRGTILVFLAMLAGLSVWAIQALIEELRSSGPPSALAPFSSEQRPQTDRYLFDYAQLLAHYEEGAHKYLRRLAERFHIEGLVVTLGNLPPNYSIEGMAVDIVNRWGIGTAYEGRGLLLLLIDQESQVKLEVGYELEDVFTDAFSGYIEDLQLKPYFQRGDVGTGLIAVMEEIERRAQIKRQGDYTPGMIAALDQKLLAGGGGAKRDLADYRNASPPTAHEAPQTEGAGAHTPEEAWRVMLAKWGGEGVDINTEVYTELTKMAMGDPNRPDPRTKAALDHWRNAQYAVLQDGDHAVIYFGNKKGWNNAPFLFCRTPAGWKFDIVHQRRLVVMTENPHWRVEQGNYPYVNLLGEVRQGTSKDLPLHREDLYACARDLEIARRIQSLERQYRQRPNDYSVVMELARLNVITGRRPNHVHPLIERAKKLDPGSADPHKYAAIYNVNTFFQYKTALKEMQSYRSKRPRDAFAQNFLGFLYYRLAKYKKSIDALTEALELQPDNVYAYSLMARDYALLYRRAKKFDPRRSQYLTSARAMLGKAETVAWVDPERVARLRIWLRSRRIL